MGASADYAVTNVEEPDIPGTLIVDVTFCTLYALELAVKLYVYKKRFFVGPDRYWNYFDALLVIQNIYEQFALLWVGSSGGSFAFLRSMRLVKMVKMLRVIRLMRSMFELRIILTSIMGSIKSMFWSVVLLTVVVFMFALIFVQPAQIICRRKTSREICHRMKH